jgi:hypothetical protein
MLRMRLPLALDLDDLADAHAWQRAHQRHQFTAKEASIVVRTQPRDGVMRLFVAKDDALDHAGESHHRASPPQVNNTRRALYILHNIAGHVFVFHLLALLSPRFFMGGRLVEARYPTGPYVLKMRHRRTGTRQACYNEQRAAVAGAEGVVRGTIR